MAFVQGLFWKNLKCSDPRYREKSCEYLKLLFNRTFLKNKTNFYFIFTGTGHFSLNEIPVVINHLKNSKESVIDFFLYEPGSYYFRNQKYNLGYYSEFHSDLNCSSDLRVAELESIEKLTNEINKPITVFHGDYGLEKIFQKKHPTLNFKCLDLALKLPTTHPFRISKKEKTIGKKFWCGNRRYTVHRHLIMSYLLNKSGNYSWRFNINKNFNLNKIRWVDDELKNLVIQTRQELNSKDFNLEFYSKKLNVNRPTELLMPQGRYNNPNFEYSKTVRECFCSIVTETRFAQPTGNFSEKTIDAINYENPFVLVAPPRTLEYLKKLGFKTFDQWWDESYDQEENHSERIKKIFKVIDYIDSLSLKQLNEIYQEIMPIIVHNKKIFYRFAHNRKIVR